MERKIAPMSIASSSFGGPHAHSNPQRGERADDGQQAAGPLGELVVHARRDLAVPLAGEQAVGDHAVQPGAELLGRDAGSTRCSSTNRRGPATRSRMIRRVHLSPTRSSARASGAHWLYG